MVGLVEVFRGMFVFGRIAAADVTTGETLAQMDPGVTHLQAFFAASAARFDFSDFSQVGAGRRWIRHDRLPPKETR